jgi:hypothetical protein
MRTRLVFGALLVASLGLAVTTSGKPAKPPLGTPVTVTLSSETGIAIQGDGGAYTDGVDGVTALIVPLGNLQLKTGDVRAFWLDFQGCVTAGTCSAPFQAGYTQGYMTTSCPESLLVMEALEWQFCNLNVHFTADGLGWFIRFGQGQDYSTTPATVTRNDTGHWTIAVPEGGIALLQSYPLKGRVTWTDYGFFYMPVSLTVTLP